MVHVDVSAAHFVDELIVECAISGMFVLVEVEDVLREAGLNNWGVVGLAVLHVICETVPPFAISSSGILQEDVLNSFIGNFL